MAGMIPFRQIDKSPAPHEHPSCRTLSSGYFLVEMYWPYGETRETVRGVSLLIYLVFVFYLIYLLTREEFVDTEEIH